MSSKSKRKYAWIREKALNIRPARKPQTGALSGVVLIVEKGTGYCYIRFPEETISIIGARMPYGIGTENTAYLKIMRMYNHYDVWCCYTDRSRSTRLWKSEKLPSWVKRIKKPKT